MHFTKRILEEQDHCYAVEVMQVQGEPYVFYAAENRGGCFAWDCETLSKRLSVWEQPGGTMSIVEIPGKPGEFLAVQLLQNPQREIRSGTCYLPAGRFSGDATCRKR